MTVIEFTPGLKPVLKHGAAPDSLKKITLLKHAQHDQSSHGRKGSNGTPLAQDAAGGMVTSESAWDSVLTDEARILAGVSETRALYPERYTPGRGRIINLKPGEIETRVVQFNDDLTLAAGIPPRVQDYQGFADAGLTQQESYNVKGGVETMDSRLVPVGPARPPQHVYRVMAVGEFDQARERGYIKTDERMNLGSDEGTVTSLRSTGSFYQPVDGSDYRVVRIKYDDADGWLRDRDSYIKTPERVPFERVDAFSPVVAGSGAVAKHGTHDQSDHGRRGSGSSTGKALDPTNADDVRKAFTGTIETRAGTVNVVVDSVDVFDFSTTVQGALIGPGGEYHGRWHRTITPEIKVMYNESFEVAEGSRKSGIGTEFQKHSERAALALGMEKINIKAADDGREAWATERFGFDFAGPPSEGLARAKAVASKMKSSATVAKITDLQSRFEGPQENWPKPHEILALKGDPALRFFMGDRNLGQQILSYGWDGRKPADRVTKQTEPKMFYVTVESDYADVAKHGTGDQSPHGRRGGGSDAPISPERVAEAFNGTYHTHTGLEFTLVANDAHYADGSGGDGGGRDGGNIRVQGEILVGDQVVGKWVRDVSGTTMIAESLNVGKDFGGNALPDAEKYQGQGIALEVQKQTEKAARNLGCTEIKVSAMNDGVAAWAQERFGYRFELKPDLRGNSKPGREPRTEEELAIPKGGMAYVQGARQYRGEDGLLLGVSHPDLGIPSVRNALAGIEERFKSRNADDWPTPAEVVSLGTGRRVSDDIIQGKTLGEFLLSRGWSGIKSSDHVTKAAGGYMRVVVEGEKGAVEKHGTGDQSPHGRRGDGSSAGSEGYVTHEEYKLRAENHAADLGWVDNRGSGQNAASSLKASVSQRLADRMDVPTAELISACFPEISGSADGDVTYLEWEWQQALTQKEGQRVYLEEGRIYVFQSRKEGDDPQNVFGAPPSVPTGFGEAEALVREVAVSNLVNAWSETSNDTSVKSLSVQRAAEDVFQIKDATPWSKSEANSEEFRARLDTHYEKHKETFQQFVRAQYDETQAMFKDIGVTEMDIYRGEGGSTFRKRGVDVPSGSSVEVTTAMRPLSSWASDFETAQSFATSDTAVILKTRIPVSRIVATPYTGNGCKNENEIVLMGGPVTSQVAGLDTPTLRSKKAQEGLFKAALVVQIDEDDDSADWIKTLSWDLPTTADGMAAAFGSDWREKISKLPAWKAAPAGLKLASVIVAFAPGLKPVAKHGIHDQSSHGNWAHGKGTGSHAGEAKMGPASPTDAYGNARTLVAGGFYEATERETEDYYRADLQASRGSEIGGDVADDDVYLELWMMNPQNKVRLFAGPNGCGVVVKGEIDYKLDFSEDDLKEHLKQVGELQRITPAPGLQIIVGEQGFDKAGLGGGTKGYVDTRDLDTMFLRPTTLIGGINMDSMMSVGTSRETKKKYSVTHEYGHVIDRRSDATSLADFQTVVDSGPLTTGSSRYAREGYFGEGVGGLQGDKPTGREMFAEAYAGWVLSQGQKSKEQGMVQFFAEKYGWDSETGTAPMAKAKGRGRIYVDTFGPEGGWVLDSLPEESVTVAFAPGFKPVLKHGTHDQSDHGNWARDTAEPDPQQVRDAWTELSELASPNTFGFEAGKIKAFVSRAVSDRMTSSVAEIVEVVYSRDVRSSVRQEEALRNARAALSTASPEVRALSPRISHVTTNTQGRLEWTYGGEPPDGSVRVHTPEADAMIKRAAVSAMIKEWSIGSNDSNLGLAIQDTAKRVFDLPDASEWDDPYTIKPDVGVGRLVNGEVSRKVLEDYVSATYETTQAMWKKMGIKSVALYRGIDDTKDQFKSRPEMQANGIMRTPVKMRPLTSWAFTEKGAQMFAGSRGVIFKAVVPIENVWSTALTGAGCHNEDEFIVLGGNIPTVAVQMSPKIDSDGGYTPHVDWDTVNKAKTVAYNIDASPMDADWIKTLSWDLPDTADEMEAFLGPDWRSIMEPLPAWLAAPESLKSGAVTKHGIHDQLRHGNWAHGRGTGSHAGEAKIGPASATDGYGNARGTTYVSGNRGETETPLPEGWFRATEKEHDDYDRAAMRYMLPIRLEDGLEPGSALEDNYLRSYKSTDAAKVQLFAGPNGTGVVVQGQISWRDDFTPEDFVQNLKQLSELQRVTPTPGLQVIVSTQTFRKLNLDESTMGFVDTRDNDTINLRPSALSAGNKYDGSWFSVMSVPETDRPKYALTHEYGHVIDRRTDESSLADFQTVVNSGRLTTGSSSYAREGYFAEGAGGRGLQVGDKPTGREMFAEAYAGWVFSKGWSARDPGMVQFFAEKYGWDSETGTAPMAKAKSKGRIYMDSFGPEGGWVLDSLPEESVTVAFAPGLKPVLKHGTGDQSPHGRRGGGGAGAGSQDGSPDDVAESDSYRMSHQPDISGPSISDVENLYPGIYENPEWYSTGDPKSDLESLAVIKKVRGNPDAMVTVYRAVPQGATTINPGDWVSLSRTYATEHGMHTTDPAQDMPVISMEVPARFVVEGSGNSINEWGYNPDSNVAKHGTGDQSPHGRRGSDGGQSSPSGQDEQSFDSWRDVPFDAGDMADINYLIEETDPPATLYHVAPKTARQDIVENGLDASGQTWNTGASEGWNEGEFNWTESDDGEKFAYEYRPTGVYMFADLGEARKYNRDGKGDIYEIDTAANDREIIRDPSQASNWEYVDEPDRAFVTRYVEPSALRVVEEPMSKHGTHDQKNHGRRYSGKVDPAVAEKAIRLVGEYGGLSIKMTDGSEPPDGYMVARNSKKFGIAVTADEFFGPRGAEHLATMVLQNRAVLGSGRAYLGVWHQTEITHEDGSKTPLARKDQVVHLDVTDRIVERSRAVSLGRRRDQISIWDVIETEEIKTGGKGADVQKRDRRGNPEAAIEDDGRRRSGVGEGGPRAVGQTGCRAVAVVKFSPGLVPVLKHGTTHNEVDHGRRGGGAGGAGAGSQDGGVTPVVNDFTDSDGNLTQPRSLRDPNHPDEEITVIPARANPMDGLNVVSIYKGGEQAGVMRYEPYSGKVEWINVEEKFRRQGVATRLWKAGKYVAAKHPNMVEPKHSESQTTEGAAWATVAKFYRSLGPILKHGTHDQMMQPPVVFKFVPGLVPVLKHGDPSRPGYAALHPNSGHASVRSGVTATGAGERMADLPEPARAKVQAWCDSNNVDIDAIADDMFRAFDVPEAVRQGGRWYKAEFQHHAILMAERQGISVEESTAAIAITSARTRWAAEDGTLVNVRTAERFYEDQKAGRYDGMTAEQAARAVPNGYLMGNGFGQNVIAMMKGEISIDEAVTGAKRRSFFNNGMFPEHDTSATMDVWMGHYMARQSGMPILRVQNALSAKAPAYLKDAGHDMSPAYFVLREATLRAHDRAMAGGRVAEDWLPLQSQATMWVAISQGYLGAVEGVDE